jgi:hypothetical protein
MDTPERSVWVFLGERAHWPSGVFTWRESEPEFIGGFTTAMQEHWHFTDGVNG